MSLGAVTDDFGSCSRRGSSRRSRTPGFLAVALTGDRGLVAPDRKGRALSILLGGTTVATIAGVPGGALLGALFGWRATFWAVAVLCLPAALGILRGLPVGAPGATAGPLLRTELAVLRRPRLILVMGVGALVNAATFGAFTYIAPVVTETAGLGSLWVPVVLVLFGVGSFTGVAAAGRLSDHRPGAVIAACGPLLLLGWCALAVWAAVPTALLVLAFAQGALAFAVGSTLIARVLYEGAAAPTMAGSYATAALNIGAAAGPVIAALSLGTGSTGPIWASAALVAAALLLAARGRGVFASSAGTPLLTR